MNNVDVKKFQALVWNFYKKNKRSLPWRNTTDPYEILVSEIMLQQTQALRVVPFYERWIRRFPDIKTLAKADFKQIYPLWNGLGYNRRALALQKSAQHVAKKGWPENLQDLSGVGPYTARAVAIFAYNRPLVCIETNIRRVFIHHFFEDQINITDGQILEIAERAAPAGAAREWHWALMDYGAYLKTQIPNPNRHHKNYTIQSKFEGSLRQIRGRVLKGLATTPKTLSQLASLNPSPYPLNPILEALEKEGFIVYKNKKYYLA